jgi:site-specific DNA-methyltransferase (adenine-specific)
MEHMKTIPDKYYDLAVIDPPYGIGENWKKDRFSKFHKHESTYKNKSTPDESFFKEIFRVSKNQIIFGANYYTDFLPATNSWIVWDKDRDVEKQKLSECELAWTSFKIPMRIKKLTWNGFCTCEKRYGVHPHEKPIQLYDWIYIKYSNPGDKILDTHLGGGSSAIAAHYCGVNFVGCEIDENYYSAAVKRFGVQTAQEALF